MKNYIPSLNGLRALSIIIVILGHLNLKTFGKLSIPFPFSIFFDGGFGVNVFFVISGFLITTLLVKEEKESGTISLKNFYIRRIFRIFPAYYFLLFVYLILQLFSILYFTKQSWLSSLFYYKYLGGSDWESGHFWSLSVEEHFYLVWPLIFLFFKKFRIFFALIVIVLVLFFRVNTYLNILHYPILNSSVSIFQRADAIMIGCLFGLYRERMVLWSDKFFNFMLAPILLLMLIAFFNADYITQWNAKYKLHLGFLLVPLGVGSSSGTLTNILIGLMLLLSISIKNVWFNFLNLPIMNYLGKLSYSLYLWQQMFFSERLGIFSKFPINILCILITAVLSYRFIELPFLKLKAKFEFRKDTQMIRKLAT